MGLNHAPLVILSAMLEMMDDDGGEKKENIII